MGLGSVGRFQEKNWIWDSSEIQGTLEFLRIPRIFPLLFLVFPSCCSWILQEEPFSRSSFFPWIFLHTLYSLGIFSWIINPINSL